jgi:hypothetical protein
MPKSPVHVFDRERFVKPADVRGIRVFCHGLLQNGRLADGGGNSGTFGHGGYLSTRR